MIFQVNQCEERQVNPVIMDLLGIVFQHAYQHGLRVEVKGILDTHLEIRKLPIQRDHPHRFLFEQVAALLAFQTLFY